MVFKHFVHITTISVWSLLVGSLPGCGGKTSTAEKTEFARLYAELLIIENIHPNDTVRRQQAVDSLLEGTEFADREEMKEWIEELTVTDPKGLQETLDSTQKYLERIRNEARQTEAKKTDTTEN